MQLEVDYSGRTTHRIIAQLTDRNWLTPEREEELKDALHAMAIERDWTPEGRVPGMIREIPYIPDDPLPLTAESAPGSSFWKSSPHRLDKPSALATR